MLMFSRGIEPPPPPPCSWPCSRPPANAGTAPKVNAADPAAAPARNARRSKPSSRMRCAPPVRPGSTYPRRPRMDHPHARPSTLRQSSSGGGEPVGVDVHRRREVVALAEVAPDLAQHVELGARLDALGDDLQTHGLGQADDE